MRRRTWWGLSAAIGVTATFAMMATAVAMAVVYGVAAGLSDSAGGQTPSLPGKWIILPWIALFAWPSLAIAVKRGHDVGIRAVWVLIPSLLSYYILVAPISGLAGYASLRYDAGDGGWAIVFLLLLLSLFAPLVVVGMLGFHGGTQGANRFGSSPKDSHRGAERVALVFD